MTRELLALAFLTLAAMACNKTQSDDPNAGADTARTLVATSPASSTAAEAPAAPNPAAKGAAGGGTTVTTTGGGTKVNTGDGTHVDTTGGGVKVETGGVKVKDGTVVVPGVGTIKGY